MSTPPQIYDNEREVGEGVRASGVPRDEIFITTKVWSTRLLAAANSSARRKESLVRLRLSEVDLLLMHWPNPSIPLSETHRRAVQDEARRAGAPHRRCPTSRSRWSRRRCASSTEPLVCNQIEFHPYLDQTKIVDGVPPPRARGRRLQPDRARARRRATGARSRSASATARAPRRCACAGWCSRASS